jgi:hypothetical protein
MEMYILDSLWRREAVIDVFKSFIWTERYAAWGDFELIIPSTAQNRNRLVQGLFVSMDKSFRVGKIETVQDEVNDDGIRMLTVKGRTLEAILEDRLARGATSGLDAAPKWVFTEMTPKEILQQMFHDICVTGILNEGDIIPGIIEGSELFPEDTIDPPADDIPSYEVQAQPLYSAMGDVAKAYDLGYRIVRDPVSNLIYFDTYTGCNRTSKQATLPTVIFSPDMDNLKNVKKLTTVAGYKNVAYVLTNSLTEVVYGEGISPDIEGFERNVLIVDGQDITDGDVSAKAIQRGKDELKKYRQLQAIDGELADSVQYVYQEDYWLGDMIELRDDEGLTTDMRIAEQIFVHDEEGERNYPTLSINTFITPGSWLAYDPVAVWEDLGETDYWEDQV